MTEATAESERPADSPTPPEATPDSDLDSLLAEFDAKTQSDQPPTTETEQPRDNAIDELLAGYSADEKRISDLQGQVDTLQMEAHRAKELDAFSEYASDIQAQLPSWLPPDWAETKLRSLAHDKELCLAFDLRAVDRKAANFELQKVQAALWQLQQNPQADPARVKQLNDYAYRLNVAVTAPAILRKARLDIINAAARLKPPIDEDTTAWRAEIAASMRGASMPLDFKDPPPNFGQMSDAEFRDYTKRNYGF
jgi:hypothetical protein